MTWSPDFEGGVRVRCRVERSLWLCRCWLRLVTQQLVMRRLQELNQLMMIRVGLRAELRDWIYENGLYFGDTLEEENGASASQESVPKAEEHLPQQPPMPQQHGDPEQERNDDVDHPSLPPQEPQELNWLPLQLNWPTVPPITGRTIGARARAVERTIPAPAAPSEAPPSYKAPPQQPPSAFRLDNVEDPFAQIRAAEDAVAQLPCPVCGGRMIARMNGGTQNLFLGCRTWPVCRGTRDPNRGWT